MTPIAKWGASLYRCYWSRVALLIGKQTFLCNGYDFISYYFQKRKLQLRSLKYNDLVETYQDQVCVVQEGWMLLSNKC